MIIKSINIDNFQCYFGSKNLFEFTDGINLILGNVNRGKSKLFDAFYWAFFGNIYITGEEWVNTNRLGVEFINDKAKYEASEGDEVTCSVEIVLDANIEDFQTLVTVKRKVSIRRRANYEWFENHAWSIPNSSIELSYYDAVGNYILLDNQAEVDNTLRILFPIEIRNYIWFQGEALDKLIDFSNKSTFEQAIKHISYFPKYEKLLELISFSTDMITKEKNKKINAQTSNKRDFEKKKVELESKQRELEVAKKDLLDIIKQEEDASKVIDETEVRLKALHDFPPLHAKKVNAENDREQAKKLIDDLVNKQKERFQQLWMLNGIVPLLEEAKAKLLEYDEKRTSGEKYTLPDDVPPKVFLEQMLKAHKCLVCDTDAEKGSKAYNFIKDRIEKQEKYYREIQENQELFAAVNQVVSFPDELILKLVGLKEEIIDLENKLEKAIKKRNDANQRVNEVHNEILSLTEKYKIIFSEGISQSSVLNSKLKTFYEIKSSSKVKKERKERQISDLEKQVSKLQDELNGFIPKTSIIPEVKWYEISTILKGVIEKVKETAKSELIRKIEDRANQHYWNITKHNNAVDGKITIDPDTYQITRTENDMYVIKSGNTGNYTLMKMCIISAMLSLNKEVSEDEVSYPFITDAPTSNFDDGMTIAYIQSLHNTFAQSIIITKDINVFRLKELNKDSRIKTIYELATQSENLEISFDTEDDDVTIVKKLTQYEAYTVNKRIK